MQAESSYNCCRLQHGCRFVQLQVRGCKLLYVTVRASERPPWSAGEGLERVGEGGAWLG